MCVLNTTHVSGRSGGPNGHAATCRLHDLNVQLPGGVYKAIARSNQGKRSIGANARQGRGGTVRARRTFWPRREGRKQVKMGAR